MKTKRRSEVRVALGKIATSLVAVGLAVLAVGAFSKGTPDVRLWAPSPTDGWTSILPTASAVAILPSPLPVVALPSPAPAVVAVPAQPRSVAPNKPADEPSQTGEDD